LEPRARSGRGVFSQGQVQGREVAEGGGGRLGVGGILASEGAVESDVERPHSLHGGRVHAQLVAAGTIRVQRRAGQQAGGEGVVVLLLSEAQSESSLLEGQVQELPWQVGGADMTPGGDSVADLLIPGGEEGGCRKRERGRRRRRRR
jgi:hypothetical protein